MKREYDLQRRLRSLQTLSEAVGAMKSLSAHHFLEARNAVEPARAYRQGVERIVAWAAATLTAGGGPAGLLIIGAELGLCGSYNAQLIAAGVRRRTDLGQGPTMCVGHRAAILLARRNIEVGRSYGAPTSVRGITDLLLRLAEDVLTTYVTEQLSSFDIMSSRFEGAGIARPTSVRLLPVTSNRSASAKSARYVSQDRFASAAIREFLYIILYDLLLDALASEHGARLIATQSAEKWLKESMERLRRHLASMRHEANTQEIIEIASGARGRS